MVVLPFFFQDNNIEFWRKFVAEYFAPNARKKWCVSLYGNGRHTTGVFPQVSARHDFWLCIGIATSYINVYINYDQLGTFQSF